MKLFVADDKNSSRYFGGTDMKMKIVYIILYPLSCVLGWILTKITDCIYSFIYRNEHETVSQVTDPILLQPAIILAEKVRSREYRAEDVMSAFIARAKEVNLAVNAIVGEQYDQALRSAKKLDAELDSLTKEQIEKDYGPDKKPFLGVPLSVKEAIFWRGMSNTSGVVTRKHIRCKENAPILDKMIEAGAIPFIQSNISDACMWIEASNYVYGCTKNAYNSSRMVGGSSVIWGKEKEKEGSYSKSIVCICGYSKMSHNRATYRADKALIKRDVLSLNVDRVILNCSLDGDMTTQFNSAFQSAIVCGGEGCIISTGASVIGLGSDIGGSIRLPCFFNGIFGHRISQDIIPNSGQWPAASAKANRLLSTGPLCRYCVDLIPALKALAEPEKIAILKLDKKVEMKNLRVISVPDNDGSLIVSKVDPELKDIQRKVAQYLQNQGARVSEKTIPKFRMGFEMWAGCMNLADDGPKFSEMMAGQNGHKVNCFKEFLLNMLRMSEHTLPAILLGLTADVVPQFSRSIDMKVVQILDKLREELVELLGNDGVLLYPSHPKIAPYHDHAVCTPFNFSYTCLFNALSFPVTQCPLGLSKDGLPLGIQVVASPYNDRLTLAVASVLEQGFGGWVNPGSK